MIDTISTADHCLAEPTEQFLRRIGKSDARAEVLVVGPGTRGVVAVDERPQCSTRAWIWSVEVQNRLGAVRFMSRSIHVVAEAQIQRQIFAELKIILDVSGVIVLVPPGNGRGKTGTLLLRETQQETGERVACLGVACREGRLEIAKFVVR